MTTNNEKNIRECPYCKEEIQARAIKCKHCHSKLVITTNPTHDGICPYCKEEIHKEANKCKHCQSNLIINDASYECKHTAATSEVPQNEMPFALSRPALTDNLVFTEEDLYPIENRNFKYFKQLGINNLVGGGVFSNNFGTNTSTQIQTVFWNCTGMVPCLKTYDTKSGEITDDYYV